MPRKLISSMIADAFAKEWDQFPFVRTEAVVYIARKVACLLVR